MHHLGIPYAAPPVGPLRWKAPAPPEPWRGSRKCTKVGPPGYQRAGVMDDFFVRLVDGLGIGRVRGKALGVGMKLAIKKPSEDCLTLNVHAPAGASGLPVMVWIHGGDHTDRRRRSADVQHARRSPSGVCARDDQLPARADGLLRPSRSRRRIARRGVGQLRAARSDRRARVGARQHRRRSVAIRRR